MKLENVKVGDLVEAKVDIVKRRVVLDDLVILSGTICKVVNKEHSYYTSRLSVGIEAEGVKIWCNHKDLRKHLPKLKTLDQSVFDDLDEKYRFAAICCGGKLIASENAPEILTDGYYCEGGYLLVGTNYNTKNWKNSLIERDKAELTGNDLCRAMLDRGDKWVVCVTSGISESHAISCNRVRLVTHYADGVFEQSKDMYWNYVVPINRKCEPLTAKDVGL